MKRCCPRCNGTGVIIGAKLVPGGRNSPPITIADIQKCHTCSGSGVIYG